MLKGASLLALAFSLLIRFCRSHGQALSSLRTTEKAVKAVGLGVAPSTKTDWWVMTDAKAISGTCFEDKMV